MNFRRLVRNQETVVALIFIALVLIIGVINPHFLKMASLTSMLNNSLILIVVSVGEMFVILTRGIDVSVGAIMGLSAVILGVTLNAGMSLPLAILLALATGTAAGMVNGVGIAVFDVPPIIMTLGTLGIYRGLMLIITGGSWIETIPHNIKAIAELKILGIGAFAWMTLAVVLLTTWLLYRLRQARYFYAVGDNEEGAYWAGIPVKMTLFVAYTLAGVFSALGAIIFVSRIGFIPMQTGSGIELKAIAATVLGGVNLMGGVGTPISALIGGLFLATVDSVLVFLKVPAFWNNAVAGAILLIVVTIDFRIRQMMEDQQRAIRAQSRIDNATLSQSQMTVEEAQSS